MINMEHYRVFRMTARFGNLTKAADALHLTQPSVSYAIKQLEDQLGVKLFDRLPKGVRLTGEGRKLQAYVEQSFALIERGEKELDAVKRGEAGELRLGASGPIIKQLLVPCLNRFRSRNPGINIRLLQRKTPEIVRELADETIDIGFVHLPLQSRAVEVKPLLVSPEMFVVGGAFRAYAEHKLSPQELAGLPLLLLSPDSSTRRFVERWFAEHGLSVQAAIELSSNDMLLEFALQGYGAAFLPRSAVEHELAERRLFELQPAPGVPPREIGFAIRKKTGLPIAAQTFLNLILEESQAEQVP
ncbi:LysR family transcriptional regulator [Paenibacillus humicola]|uniref:LysR family transcriptional regulator n=1 Tax=Paenibacillus humicola TaxID=3110540 RepID=UPI00237B853D|nr:LysR family transcriptional regulator [Paenibacillus humicola]